MSASLHPMPVQPPLPDYLQAFGRDMESYIQDAMQRSGTPGVAVAIVKDSQIVLLRGFGVKKMGTRDSIDAQTLFRLGSLSKGFAGVLAGMLVKDSLLSWNTPVQQLYPAFQLRDKRQTSRIQLWHVLSHTTGLPYHAYTNMIEAGYSLDKIVDQYFPSAPISGKEGAFYAYQNVAYCISEKMMQQATGKTYQQLLQTRIFQPAGMSTASCDYTSLVQMPNKAQPHLWSGYGCVPIEISPNYYDFAAAGGVNASASDMAQWLMLLMGQKPEVVTAATLDPVFKPVISTEKERRVLSGWIRQEDAFYAMGWRVLQHESDTIIYHAGYVNGFQSEIAFDRRSGIGIVLLANGQTDFSGQVVPAFFDRWAAYKK